MYDIVGNQFAAQIRYEDDETSYIRIVPSFEGSDNFYSMVETNERISKVRVCHELTAGGATVVQVVSADENAPPGGYRESVRMVAQTLVDMLDDAASSSNWKS